VKDAQPKQRADQRADDAGGDRANRQRHEYFEESLHQNLAVHTQDAADDDASDEQVKEVGVLGEFNDGFFDLWRQQLVIGERRGDESGKDRGCSDIA
jgi:hypothetical protein